MEYHIARVNYHYRKLQMTRERLPATDAGANVEFEAYVFFEVCFHLKDWIKSDPRYDMRCDDVDVYINQSKPLRTLHDVCNRLKHRTLSRPKTNIGPFNMTFTIEVGPDGAYQRLNRLEAEVDGEIVCMYVLADQAVLSWAAYFNAHPTLRPAAGCTLLAPACSTSAS
ncbi:hypothetical protein [Massilia sp.]|uniref:hypothetical protein n=1 Tax=Massilia sp. TaxID=1882437 RepID=UPI003918BDFC